MQTAKIKLVGESPILLACDRLADPLDPATIEHKKLTAIRGKAKTAEIQLALYKSTYLNAIYYDDKVGVHIPSINIKKCLEEGAKLTRNGDKVRKGVMIFDEKIALNYGKKKLNPEQLWADPQYRYVKSVVVSKSKIMAYRPKFTDWSLEVDITFDEDIIQADWMVEYLNAAGRYVGLGGFRPANSGMFGRFIASIA
ncbi:MAG TPA: hypothetical protein EYF95_02120 [Flavobacteriales bacterium]|nr:hypothetical protein [Flavobacteriales bacterium]